MIIVAVIILMAASALLTAAAFAEVQSHTNKAIPYVGSMEPRASPWLFLSGLLAVGAGSFVYSQSQGRNSTVEFIVNEADSQQDEFSIVSERVERS